MGRRIRHMNPADHDAIRGGTCIDSRFIAGVSSGTGLQTWDSRPGGTHTYSQPTSARRPIFTEVVSSRGGQPAVVFTSASQHWMSRAAIAVGSTTNPYAIIGCGFGYAQTSNTSFLGATNTSLTLESYSDNFKILNTGSQTVGPLSFANNTQIGVAGRSGSTTLFLKGRLNSAEVTGTNATPNLNTTRNNSSPSSYIGRTMCSLCIATSAISASMINRIIAHYAFSFKNAQ